MVDKVKLSPSQFSKRSGGLSVPGSGDVPSLRNLPTVRDVGTEAQANALLSLADDGQRLASMAGEQFNRHMDEVKRNQRIEAEKVYAESLNAIQDGITSIRETEGNIEDIPGKTLEFYNNSTSEFINSAEGLSSYQKQVLSDKFNQNRLNVTNQALGYQAQLRSLESSTAVAELVQSTSSYLYKNPGQLDIRLAEMSDAIVEAGINPIEAESLVQEQRAALASSAIQGLVNQNPVNALQRIRDGQFDSHIDGPTKDRLAKFAKSSIEKIKVKLSVEDLRALGEFQAQINEDPLSVTDADIAQARDMFKLSDREVSSMFRDRMEAEIEAAGTEADNARILDAIHDGETYLNPKNPDDVKASDKFFSTQVNPVVQNLIRSGDTQGASTVMADFVASTGIAPKSMKDELLGRVRTGSPDQRKFAIDTLGKIKLRSPNADLGISAEDQAAIDVFGSITKFESDQDAALQQADNILRMDEGMRKQREDAVRKNLKDVNVVDEISSGVQPGFFGRLFMGKEKAEVDVPSGSAYRINKDYRDAYEAYFVNNPDDEKAREYAEEKVLSRSGVTELGDTPSVMRYAPEKIMPAIDGSHEYLAIDFDETVKPLIPEGKRAVLVEDEFTIRNATPEVIERNGIGPSYGVLVYDEDGLPDSLRDENGDILRYQLPMPTQEMKEAQRKRRLEEFSKQREKLSGTIAEREVREMREGAESRIEQLKGLFD